VSLREPRAFLVPYAAVGDDVLRELADERVNRATHPMQKLVDHRRIDVDPRNDGEESHHALVQRLGAYRTIRSLTGGRGTHDLFRVSLRPIRLGANAFGDG
jgi:hypothetical protein